MRKSTHSDEYACVTRCLTAMRREAGMTQRDLARKLNREPSFVWRIENGERRLDVVEFHWVCQALGQETGRTYLRLLKQFAEVPKTIYPGPDPLPKVAENNRNC